MRGPTKLCKRGHRYRGRGGCPTCRAQSDARYTSPEYRRNRKLCLMRDGNRCVKCGSTTNLTAHHVLPIAYGGTHDLDNLRTMCDLDNKRADAEFRSGALT